MAELSLTPTPKSRDVQCLKCGVFNIPDNRVCGRCGASLPVVYDSKGDVFRWEEAMGYEGLMGLPSKDKRRNSVNRTRWILRGLVLLIAIICALFILNARK
jgi:hypothetical protein